MAKQEDCTACRAGGHKKEPLKIAVIRVEPCLIKDLQDEAQKKDITLSRHIRQIIKRRK